MERVKHVMSVREAIQDWFGVTLNNASITVQALAASYGVSRKQAHRTTICKHALVEVVLLVLHLD